jgi:predicted aldo/keto reductase-like oxidoreductase
VARFERAFLGGPARLTAQRFRIASASFWRPSGVNVPFLAVPFFATTIDLILIPLRQFGRHNVRISGHRISAAHHLGDAPDEPAAVRLVRQAVDGGITFFDNCWEYHRGKTEAWMGAGLAGVRDRVFLMTKVCTHGRDKALALRMLEESLHRLRTDHLDLWQIHGVCFDNDPALFIRKGGAAEALEQAKKQGKVRFVGFTGHKDPSIHLKMLATGFPFDSVQMPLNAFDANSIASSSRYYPS